MPLTFQQPLKFKNNPEAEIDSFQFDGGLITDIHETKLEPNQSPDLANVIFNQSNSAKTRNGYLRYNGDPITVAADQDNSAASNGTNSLTTVDTWRAQTFIPSGTINCVQIKVYLAMNTSGQTQNVRLEIWSTSASAPSAIVANGQSQILQVSGTSETAYSFRFNQPVALAASTTYAFVVRPFVSETVAEQTMNQVNIYSHQPTNYANGSEYSSTDAGITWSIVTNVDFRFIVYSAGDTGCTGLMRYYTSTAIKQLIAKFGTTLYTGNDSTGAMTVVTLGSGVALTAANFIDWTISNDTLLVVDGTHKIQKYRGSLNANYSTGTITATNGSAVIVGSGTSWNTTTNCVVGEYIQLPDTKWYKIVTVTDDTHVTIEISYQGATLAGQTYKISPWGEVLGKLNTSAVSTSTNPLAKFIEVHLNRIWVTVGNILYFSVLDTSVTEENFNDFDTTNNSGQIIIPAGQGDVITGLYSVNGYLYIFQRNAIWEVFGTSPSNFELRNVSSEIGMIDKRTLVEFDRQLFFLSDNGVYQFDGANLTNLSMNRVNNLIDTWANVSSPVAILTNNTYMLSYTPSGDSYNSECIFYDIINQVWGKVEGLYAGAWSVWKGGNDNGEVYVASSNQGSIYKWNTGTHDDGYEIDTRYSTPSIDFGAKVNDKTVKKVYLQQLALGHWGMFVKMFSDIGQVEADSLVDLDNGNNSLWDVSQWDVDLWSTQAFLTTDRIAEFQGTAKYFRFLFEQNGYSEGMEVLGLTTTARIRRLT